MSEIVMSNIEKRIITSLFQCLYNSNKINKHEYKNLLNKLNKTF